MTGSAALVGAGACAGYVGNAFYLNNVAADAATATGERRRYVLRRTAASCCWTRAAG